jgi:hypothetical protein
MQHTFWSEEDIFFQSHASVVHIHPTHTYMHAITQYARSQHKHTQQKNAREIHSD